MKKTFFVFLLLFSLVLILGCVGGGGTGDLGPGTEGGIIERGNLNGTVYINGKPSSDVNLLGEQTAEMSFRLRNTGEYTLKNLDTKIIGCLTSQEGGTGSADEIRPGQEAFLTWSVKAPLMSQGERISCPVIVRACYDYTSEGYTDIPIANEKYTGEITAPSSYIGSDLLSAAPSIGILRVINTTSGHNSYIGRLIVSNIGPGWVDYITYPEGSGKSIHKFEKINLTLGGDLMFDSIGGIDSDSLVDETDCMSNNKKSFELTANDTKADLEEEIGDEEAIDENYDYMLKLVGGKELTLNFQIGADFEDYPADPGIYTERLSYKIDHGYCTDVATITAHLSGN